MKKKTTTRKKAVRKKATKKGTSQKAVRNKGKKKQAPQAPSEETKRKKAGRKESRHTEVVKKRLAAAAELDWDALDLTPEQTERVQIVKAMQGINIESILVDLARTLAVGEITNRNPDMPPVVPGECYTNAFNFANCNQRRYEGIKVVHGYPQDPDGQVIGHAWVEWLSYCYDPTNDEQMGVREYYFVGKIVPEECRYYSPKEALELMEQHSNYGPWEDVRSDADFR